MSGLGFRFSSVRHWVALSGLLALLVLAVLVVSEIFTHFGDKEPQPAPSPAAARGGGRGSSGRGLQVSGMTYETRLPDGTQVRVRVGELQQRGRKFGPLTFQPLQELVISGLGVEILRTGSARSGGAGVPEHYLDDPVTLALRDLIQNALGRSGGTPPSRFLIQDFDVVMKTGSTEPLTLHSGEATWSAGKPLVHLGQGVEMRFRGDGRLTCREAAWSPSRGELHVTGPYLLHSQGELTSGSEATFAVDPAGGLRLLPPEE